jgi:hypothetical protein
VCSLAVARINIAHLWPYQLVNSCRSPLYVSFKSSSSYFHPMILLNRPQTVIWNEFKSTIRICQFAKLSQNALVLPHGPYLDFGYLYLLPHPSLPLVVFHQLRPPGATYYGMLQFPSPTPLHPYYPSIFTSLNPSLQLNYYGNFVLSLYLLIIAQ